MRINVYSETEDEYGENTHVLAGWFNSDSATRIDGETEWDGHSHVSIHTGSELTGENLYRTAGGRYVHHKWSRLGGGSDSYRFLSSSEAREWLTRNGSDDIVEAWFGELEEEAGPPVGGRPAIGAATTIKLGDELTARIDAARLSGESRAAAIRRLVRERLDAPARAVWSVVRGAAPDTSAVEPGAAGLSIPDDVLTWAEAHGVYDGTNGDPDVYVLVAEEELAANDIPGEIATFAGELSASEAALIAAWRAAQD